ncbi:PREDICTED: methylated-DNA--protein-cysteine methyltransferase [Propithecus coquereli]|uniref:methylated-DNA--protein-cysteine methyltransferase n=1 Tax=Propithecus coquereli TaxID=379532 RepID=UPI00063F0149|nr:PREDICTED: methylated-DNA--protein-cysteine methyltransferase [Propithecus coquereli]
MGSAQGRTLGLLLPGEGGPGRAGLRGLRSSGSPAQGQLRGLQSGPPTVTLTGSPPASLRVEKWVQRLRARLSALEQLAELGSCRRSPIEMHAAEAPAPPEALGGPEGMTEPLAQCAAWLDAYFHEPGAISELPLPALHHPVFQQDSFTRQVLWKLLKVVKFGETVSYQQLAALAGNPKAARAVGGAMRSNPVPILVPCHRVVCSSGALGSYSGGVAVKEWLLAHEGDQTGKPNRAGSSGPARAWLGAAGDGASP